LAFKDFGARFMARLMGYFVRGETRPLTGAGGDIRRHRQRRWAWFLRVPGIRVVIL